MAFYLRQLIGICAIWGTNSFQFLRHDLTVFCKLIRMRGDLFVRGLGYR